MKRSMLLRTQLTFLMALLVILQSVALVMALSISGVFFLLDSESFRLFSNTTNTRMLTYNTSVGQLVVDVSEEAAVFNDSINKLVARSGNNASELYQSDDIYMDAAVTGTQSLITLLRNENITGAFFILNHSNTNKDMEQAHSAIYIRNSAPYNSSSGTGSYLLEVGPVGVSQFYKIPTSINWALDLQFDSGQTNRYDFYNLPIEASSQKTALEYERYGYWSPPVSVLKDNQQVIYYTVPIYDEAGEAYGVFGVEISLPYFMQIYLSNISLPYQNSFYAIAPVNDDVLSFEWFIPSGPLAQVYLKKDEQIKLEAMSGMELFEASLGGLGEMYFSVCPLKMYSSNSPFAEQNWSLVGFVPQDALHEGSSNVRSILIMSIAITTAVSFMAIFLLVYLTTRKISGLSAYVEGLSPSQDIRFKRTGMREIDDLTSAVEMLNKRVVSAFQTTSKVLELTRLPLGVFEASDESNEVILTEYIYTLLELDPEKEISQNAWKDIYKGLTANPETGHENIYQYHDQWLRILETPTDTGSVGIIFDVTNDFEENRRLARELDYDALTHLYSRKSFKREVQNKIQNQPDKVGAMLFTDLDNLKYINDTFGHDMGDRLIIHAGEMYRNFTAYGGIAARISGDEFAVYLHGFTSRDEVRKIIAEQFKENAKYTLETPDHTTHRIRASSGIAWYPEDSNNATDLLKLADFAMYEAKKSEKGSIYEFNTKSYEETSYLLENREAINRLLDEQLIRFAFQPIVDLRTGEIYAYEALMRPLLDNFKSPLEILTVAADQSKLGQLERLVWIVAFQLIHEHFDEVSDRKIFINSMAGYNISAEDRLMLQRQYGYLFKNIVIEIIEAESRLTEILNEKISFIREFGMMLAIDDYGSGYSNDLRVLAIDPDVIKIDMELIQGIHKDRDKKKLVENLVSFSHQKNVKLIAEGVEEKADILELIRLNVDYIQGYYTGKPEFAFARIDERIKQEILDMNQMVHGDETSGQL